MKPSRILMAVTLVGLLATGSTVALACGGPGGGKHHGHGGFGQMRAVYHLDNLSDEQLKQLDTLYDKERKEMRQRRNEHEDLRDAMDKATDTKTLRPLAEKQGKFVTERIMKGFELRNEVDKILTPAQRIQLQQMEDRRSEHRDMRGMSGMSKGEMNEKQSMAELSPRM